MKISRLIVPVIAAMMLLIHESAQACACSFCGGYDIGTAANFPQGSGGMVWTEYDFMSQSRNWSGTSPAAAADNPHKLIQTSWLSAGAQYFFNDDWGLSVVVPSANRVLRQDAEHDHHEDGHMDGHEEHGSPSTVRWWGMGDVQVNAYYTGLSPDMSTGFNLGVKIPSGDWTQPGVDRDNQIGTGSTDLLFGFYHRQRMTTDAKWMWYANAQLDAPVITQGGYTPGLQVGATAGLYYTGLQFGKLKIRPLAQAIFVNRASDSGPAADPGNTGYQQLSLSPGLEFDLHPLRLYADVELPVLNNVVGNQLMAPATVRLILSCRF